MALRYGKPLVLQRAAEVDAGFDVGVLAQMFGSLTRFTDEQIPVAPKDVAALRAFFAEWAAELNAAS